MTHRRLRNLAEIVVPLTALVAAATWCAITPAEGATRTSVVSRVWTEPQAGYSFIDAAIDDAHTSIDLSMYELSDPSIERALVQRARHGVDVRVILNAAYEGASENATAASVLRHGAVHVVWAPSNQIFHAKYLVIDASTAYIGTGNFALSDYSSTRDFWVADTQRADVSAVIATFNADFDHGGAISRRSGVWCGVQDRPPRSPISSPPRATACSWRTKRWTPCRLKTRSSLPPGEGWTLMSS